MLKLGELRVNSWDALMTYMIGDVKSFEVNFWHVSTCHHPVIASETNS